MTPSRDGATVARRMPPDERSPARTDTRFAAIDDAVTLLKLLPPPADIAWPTETGDVEIVTDALQWLAAWAPAARASHRAHERAKRAAQHAARNGTRLGLH